MINYKNGVIFVLSLVAIVVSCFAFYGDSYEVDYEVNEINFDSFDSFSLSENEDKAVSIALDFIFDDERFFLSEGVDLRLKNIVSARCFGCFVVDFEYFIFDMNESGFGYSDVRVVLNNFYVVDYSFESSNFKKIKNKECISKDGVVLDIKKDGFCRLNENIYAQVNSLFKNKICCVKI
jgi:hypothetical protein